MIKYIAHCELSGKGFGRSFAHDTQKPRAHTVRMGRKIEKEAANHLRAWREFRQLTQRQLAERVGTKGNVIGLLESGERQLSDKWLRKLAPALGTRPGFLLDYDPRDLDTALLEAVMNLPDDRKAEATQVLKILSTGTDG